MNPLCHVVVGLVAVTLAVSVLVDAISDKLVRARFNATSPFDPFEQLRIRATPRRSEPVCCLIPLSSEPLPTTAEFLSFEEWKSKQRELQAQAQAQSANHTNSPETPAAETSLGSSFMPSVVTLGEAAPSMASSMESVPPLSPHFRVPLTDRFNYASLDCSARVHTAHPSARSPSAILSSKKDRYMLSPCSSNPNFIVVELCDDIRIDTVQLANFEFFSGVFRDFRVSVAQTYTTDGKGWIEAGTYRAKNIRGVQSFHPLVELRPFYRYIRIDFLSHYGGEFYCPISLLRVYGLTQMEEWKWEVWQGASETRSKDSVEGRDSDRVTNETVLDSPVTANGTVLPVTEGVFTVAPTGPDPAPVVPVRVDYPLAMSDNQVSQDEKLPTQEVVIPSTPNHKNIILDPTTTMEVSATLDPETISPLITVSVTPYVSISNTTIQEPHTDTNNSFTSEDASSVVVPDSSQPMSLTSISSIRTLHPLPSPSPVPSGESIYRTIMNRLAMLETNTTLYQRYVEEQTLQVREALRRLEEDVGRLEGISKAQQQSFSKSMNDLERRRLQMEKERWELLNKISHLADEVVLEKRLGIAQLCLLLTVLVFMALTRGSRTDAISLLDGTMHKLHNIHRRSPWPSVDWTQLRGRSPTPTPRGASDTRKVSLSRGVDTFPSLTSPATPLGTTQTPRVHLRRPSTPRHHDTFPRFGSSERSITRLHRSDPHTTPSNTQLSARRFARSSHLHEVRHFRRHTRTSVSDEETANDRDCGIDGSPRPRSKRAELHLKTQILPNSGIPLRRTPGYEGSEAESWVDTEPGSELGIDYNETDTDETGPREVEIKTEHGVLQSPILLPPSSSLRRHLGNHNPPLPASD